MGLLHGFLCVTGVKDHNKKRFLMTGVVKLPILEGSNSADVCSFKGNFPYNSLGWVLVI